VRTSGLWHPRLAALVTDLRHTDTLVIADPGLPAPPHVEVVDLAWARNEPAFLPVLAALADELIVEEALVADELCDARILAGIAAALPGLPLKRTGHADLKIRCHAARAVVRTGEATPFANVILTAGVPF
jgi:D-ribose pyranase